MIYGFKKQGQKIDISKKILYRNRKNVYKKYYRKKFFLR